MEIWTDEYNEFDSGLCLAIPLTDEELYEQEINDLKSKIKCTEVDIRTAEYELGKLCYNKESAIKTFKQATLTYHETRLIELQNELKELTKNGQY